ncbi:hypothetical protein OPQ81_007366 [Rhizoctonia solani]|nr:hypothetical protein OPQ81_007366 [Rhizoctonia solani]
MSRTVFLSLSIPVILIVVDIIRKKRRGLPPGPPSYPLIRQLLSVPTSFAYIEYRKLSRKLKSNVISFEFLGNTIVVLNSVESANDLLDKRSAIYSDRTSTTMLEHEQLLNWKDLVPLTPYGDRFRAYRRIFNAWLNKNASTAFHPRHLLQTRRMLNRLLQYDGNVISSKALEEHFYLLTAASIMKTAYGYEVTSPGDPYLVNVKQVGENLVKSCLPTHFLVNLLPFLVHMPRWVPGTGWRQLAQEWRALKDKVIEDTFQWAKTQIENGAAEPSVVRSYLEDLTVGFSLFGAGTGTTAVSLEVFILAMLLYPNIQRKAQEEIDQVVGPDRLPEMDDLKSLPYLNNPVQEVLRWQVVFPVGIAHTCTQDNFYKGYLIPKGAIVFGNAWAMSRDETIYDRPEEFNPDRFNDRSVPQAPAFGWGRRKCPGVHYVESLLGISIASILATFNLNIAKDKMGRDILPLVEDTPGFQRRHVPFTFLLGIPVGHSVSAI